LVRNTLVRRKTSKQDEGQVCAWDGWITLINPLIQRLLPREAGSAGAGPDV